MEAFEKPKISANVTSGPFDCDEMNYRIFIIGSELFTLVFIVIFKLVCEE